MSEVKLTPTQHSLLLALSHKQMTITAVQAAMGGISKELTESLLKHLSQLHLITKYTNGQYRANAAGARYLKHNDKAKAAEPAVKAPTAEVAPVAVLVTDESDEPAAVIQNDVGEYFEQNEPAIPAPALAVLPEPDAINESLSELERRLSMKINAPMQIDLKLQVLNRLSLLLDPSIGEVLNNIATDLVQMQEAA